MESSGKSVQEVKVEVIEGTDDSFKVYGQVISPSPDGQEFGPHDAQLDLSRGTPRLMAPNRRPRDSTNNPYEAQADSNIAQMLALMQQQMTYITQQQQQQHQAPVVTFKSFRSVNPPEFKGSADPIEARTWLKEIQKAFELVGVGNEQKTGFASYFLKGEAGYWWESKRALEMEEIISWERFTELFLEKYFPRYIRDQMEIKFLEFKQENLSVAEYEVKFTELSSFVPEYVNTDEKRAKRFQQGLKPWIRSNVAIFELTNYAGVVQKAMIVERESELSQKEREGKKRKAETSEGIRRPINFQSRFGRRSEPQYGRNLGSRRPERGSGGLSNRPQDATQQQHQAPVVTFKSFESVNPLEFKGSADPIEARTWLKEIQKAFEVVGVGNEQKTGFASYFLKGEAGYWWESKRALEVEEIISWERFTELFLEKYFPRYIRDQMEIKFLEFKQENLSVAEYEVKFTELSSFVPVPEYVNTDEKRAKRFQQGLKPWIRSNVAIFELTNYAGVVQKAMIVERESELSQKEREGKKRKAETSEGIQRPRNFQSRFGRRPEPQYDRNLGFRRPEPGSGGSSNRPQDATQQMINRPQIPECKTCGKRHTGVCSKAGITCFKCNQRGHYASEWQNPRQGPTSTICFRCGKAGHISRNCKVVVAAPEIPRIAAAPPPQPAQPKPRIFNMTMKDVVQSSVVVAVKAEDGPSASHRT